MRKFINDGKADCSDGSDERVESFRCYEYELSCFSPNYKNNFDIPSYHKCLSYEMIRDGTVDCNSGIDEKLFLTNCTNENLFLCLDQSRCLPRKFKCDEVVNCIDGSDELEVCDHTPTIFRHFQQKKGFINNWVDFLVMNIKENFTTFARNATTIRNKGKDFIRKFMFGLKCKSNGRHNRNLYQSVSQTQIRYNRTKCLNQEKTCFDENEKFTCFRCFDKTIIFKSQVCDGVVDCQDLSDECACEESEAKTLCEVFYNNKNMKANSYDFHNICDLDYDMPLGVDEKYCATKELFTFNIFEKGSKKGGLTKCAKGKTALNLTSNVLSGDTDSFKQFIDVIYGGKRKFYRENKELSSLSDLDGSCNYKFECPFMEDECSQECLNNLKHLQLEYKIITCFSFTFENLQTISVGLNKNLRFIFNTSAFMLVNPLYKKYEINYMVDAYYDKNSELKGKYSNTQMNRSFDFDTNDVLKMCTAYSFACPWYFQCETHNSGVIDIKRVCDLHYDCKDQSDEKYCSTDTHFNCTEGIPVSISRKKVNDQSLDCADFSDECKENSVSSVKEMIKNAYLRYFIWVTSVGIIVFNVVVIRNNIRKIKTTNNKHSVMYYNLILVLSLSFSDIIFGFALVTIAFTSYKFSGVYCTKNFKWRSSTLCVALGVFTMISSQTSLNILVLLTGFRLYSVIKPFKSLDFKKHNFYSLLYCCWFLSLLLAVIPILLKKAFTQNFIISKNLLFKNKNVDRLIESDKLYSLAENIERAWTHSNSSDLPPLNSISNISDFKEWYFNLEDVKVSYPNISIDTEMTFGFYSSSAVCLPDIYSQNSTASQFSFALMIFNMFLIVCISLGYTFIFCKLRSKNFKAIQKKSFKKSSKKSRENDNSTLFRIFLIVATDVACWLPIILLTFANFFNYEIPEIVYSLTSIVFLPINSLLNPIFYSKVDVVLKENSRRLIKRLRACNIFQKQNKLQQ